MGSSAPKVPYESGFQRAKGPVGSTIALFCMAQAYPPPQFGLDPVLKHLSYLKKPSKSAICWWNFRTHNFLCHSIRAIPGFIVLPINTCHKYRTDGKDEPQVFY